MGIDLIIDSHVHVGAPPSEADPKNFVKLMKKSKIDKAVVFRYIYNEPTIEGNRLMRDAVASFPEELVGFAWIDPNQETAVSEIKTTICEWNFKGLKLHLEMSPAPIEKLREVFAIAERLSIPICVHMGQDFSSMEILCKEYNTPVIIAHLGTGVYCLETNRLEKAIALARNKNVYLETSGNTYPFIEYATKKISASKIIFGSDFPHEHPLVIARAVELLNLPEKEESLILGENIEQLIK